MTANNKGHAAGNDVTQNDRSSDYNAGEKDATERLFDALERLLGRPARTVDMHFSYLSPATTGPFRVIAGPVRVETGSVLSTVELIDLGREGRQCAVGTANAVAIEP